MLFAKQAVLIPLLLVLAACASGPKYAKEKMSGQACISDDTSYANTALTPTQGSLRFQEVDDVQINGTDEPVCLAPGMHKFKIAVRTDFRKVNGFASLELKPDVSYWLRAKLTGSYGFGNAFNFQLIDVTDDKRVTVAEFSLDAEAQTFDFVYLPGRVPSLLVLPK